MFTVSPAIDTIALEQLFRHKVLRMVRYYGYYSNVVRGKRKKSGTDDQVRYMLEPKLSAKEFRKNWARLIQKIYEVDPLVCSRCQGSMRVIAFIEDEELHYPRTHCFIIPSFDMEASASDIRSAMKEMADIKIDMSVQAYETANNMKNVLNAEQKEKLKNKMSGGMMGGMVL